MSTARISSTGEHRGNIAWSIETLADGSTRARSALFVVGNVGKPYVPLAGREFRVRVNAIYDDHPWSVNLERFAH